MSVSSLSHILIWLITICGLGAQGSKPSHLSQPQPQISPIRVAINVNNPSLPVTLGVPLSEAFDVLDAAQLGITDENGTAVPSQMRTLARWRGLPNDKSKPIKWLLVDFKPNATGVHYLTRGARADFKPVKVIDADGSFRIANSQLEVEFLKQGEGLVKSFKLGEEEMLKTPITLQTSLPARAMITQLGSAAGLGPNAIIVNDASSFKPGDAVRFEHTDSLKWDSAAGSARIVTNDMNFAANRRYRIDEGTPQQEDIEVSTSTPGDLRTSTSLKFAHDTGSTIRDLTAEQDATTIGSISGQTIQFTSPLKVPHVVGETVLIPGSGNQPSTGLIERTKIEESNNLRVVVRQDGFFKSKLGKTPPTLAFTLRYYIYADQPFVRVRLRMMNNGTYGFGAYRTLQGPYPQHAILRSLSVLVPTIAKSSGDLQVLTASEARGRVGQKQSGASLSAGTFEIAVPEFVENFPKALHGSSSGMRFDILPDINNDYQFDGARAKTTDFYLGRGAVAARALTNRMGATLSPAYIASTGAVRPLLIEKSNWGNEFGQDFQTVEAVTRVERMFATGYAVEASEGAGAVPAMSIFEYRQRGENGPQLGWRNFGDLAWGDGYANVHYDLPFILLREFLRTGDARAFQLGSEMARYRADWGHYRANDYVDREHVFNFKGLAFYEKGDHGSFREPLPSHSWIEGMWLYWALTGDEAVRESALEGSDAFARINFTFDNALSWNEPRYLGWPILGLVVAYRYTGDTKYLDKARVNVNLMFRTEESYGRKGYYIATGSGVIQAVQPWSWGGYAVLGMIEYWRDTGDKRTADFLVRVADWLIGKGTKNNPPIKPSKTLPDGTYLPNGVSYSWEPDKIAEDRSVALAGLCLPVLTTAARITDRADLWSRAHEIFRDYAFYRDLAEGKSVPPSTRAVINFRSLLFASSVPKVYGQMGLTVSEYLPMLVASGRLPRNRESSASGYAPEVDLKSAPATTKPVKSAGNTAGLTNVAFKRPAMASSVQAFTDAIGAASAANDGERIVSGRVSIWHSAVNSGQIEWWQVDLTHSHQIKSIEIFFRDDQDQPTTRRNFEVRGSNDLSFDSSTVLGSQGKEAVPYGQSWVANVNDTRSYRYIRVQKTMIDPDESGNSYFNLVEVNIYSQTTQPTTTTTAQLSLSPSAEPVRLGELKPNQLMVGQTLRFTLSQSDEQGEPLELHAYNLPSNSRFDETTGEFWFTPTSDHAGNVYQITFRAKNKHVDKYGRLDVTVIIDGAPKVMLTAPTTQHRLVVDQFVNISWSTSHTTQITKHQLMLSTDGGATYPTVLAELPGDANQYKWQIPKDFSVINRALVRFMVKSTDALNRTGVDYTRQNLRVSPSPTR